MTVTFVEDSNPCNASIETGEESTGAVAFFIDPAILLPLILLLGEGIADPFLLPRTAAGRFVTLLSTGDLVTGRLYIPRPRPPVLREPTEAISFVPGITVCQ
jgi:hypothetical protein